MSNEQSQDEMLWDLDHLKNTESFSMVNLLSVNLLVIVSINHLDYK